MESSATNEPCIKCKKGAGTATCCGCHQSFCIKHFLEHRQELATQMEHVNQEHDLFQEDLSQENKKHPLISRINDWEQQLIKNIQLAAEEARKDLDQYLDHNRTQLKKSLSQIAEDLQTSRESDDYTEIDVNNWIEQLKQLRERLEKPATIDIIYDDQAKPTIRLIKLKKHETMVPTPTPEQETRVMTRSTRFLVEIDTDDKWIQHGITVAGGYGQGNRSNQLYGPHGLYVDNEKTLYIADYDNHRVVEWKYGATSAQVIAGGTGRGNRLDRLDNPANIIVDEETNSLIICDRNNRRVMRWSRQNQTNQETIISNLHCEGLAMDDEGFLYVSDSGKHEVRRYRVGENNGTIVAGGHGKGNRLNQLSFPTNIYVDQDRSIYISDSDNHRIVKWVKDSKEGIIVAGGQGKGNTLAQLSNPRGVIVDSLGVVYVVDGWNHRVMRWCNGVTQGDLIVGGNGQGELANQLSYPEDLAFDRDGNIYVADCLNHRIQRFDIQMK